MSHTYTFIWKSRNKMGTPDEAIPRQRSVFEKTKRPAQAPRHGLRRRPGAPLRLGRSDDGGADGNPVQ